MNTKNIDERVKNKLYAIKTMIFSQYLIFEDQDISYLQSEFKDYFRNEYMPRNNIIDPTKTKISDDFKTRDTSELNAFNIELYYSLSLNQHQDNDPYIFDSDSIECINLDFRRTINTLASYFIKAFNELYSSKTIEKGLQEKAKIFIENQERTTIKEQQSINSQVKEFYCQCLSDITKAIEKVELTDKTEIQTSAIVPSMIKDAFFLAKTDESTLIDYMNNKSDNKKTTLVDQNLSKSYLDLSVNYHKDESIYSIRMDCLDLLTKKNRQNVVKIFDKFLENLNLSRVLKQPTTTRKQVVISLRELVENGTYESIDSARNGVASFINFFGGIRFNEFLGNVNSQVATTTLFTIVTFNKQRTLLYFVLNTDKDPKTNKVAIDWNKFNYNFAISSKFKYALDSSRAIKLDNYITTQARINHYEIAKNGFIKRRLETIRQELLLPSMDTIKEQKKRPDMYIKTPLLDAINDIMNLSKNIYTIEIYSDRYNKPFIETHIDDLLKYGYIIIKFSDEFIYNLEIVSQRKKRNISSDFINYGEKRMCKQQQEKAIEDATNNIKSHDIDSMTDEKIKESLFWKMQTIIRQNANYNPPYYIIIFNINNLL